MYHSKCITHLLKLGRVKGTVQIREISNQVYRQLKNFKVTEL